MSGAAALLNDLKAGAFSVCARHLGAPFAVPAIEQPDAVARFAAHDSDEIVGLVPIEIQHGARLKRRIDIKTRFNTHDLRSSWTPPTFKPSLSPHSPSTTAPVTATAKGARHEVHQPLYR
jgi:hypothetical protein